MESILVAENSVWHDGCKEAYVKQEKYRKGQMVFWQGDPGDCMYSIRWGRVVVIANYGEMNEEKLAELGEGDFFGEMGLLDHAPRTATIISLENNTILHRIDEDEFEQFLRENPARVMDILQNLSHKLRATTRAYLKICRAVSESVGAQEDEVAEATTYGFAQNETLKVIHDDVQDTVSDEA